ncbi:MAG: MBL fold metallo-hydrolase [Candidatus Lokiarchaeota archaeon]|nr:MBL fold metallo-hydrolase [Candidatus Lokiarchaeota archaeon]
MRLSFLGSCREVGRSAVLVESDQNNDRILLDYGVKMDGTEDNFPEHIRGRDLSAIVVTHAHIDHVGGIPIFFISGSVPLFMTRLTQDVSDVLLRDMINIARYNSNTDLLFDREVLGRMHRHTHTLRYTERVKVGKDSHLTLFNNGHIPGSAMALVEMDGQTMLYTSDMNATQTQLMNPVHPLPNKIDALVTESTYGTTDHEPREEVEKRYIEKVQTVLENGGTALTPAFGVSRSQEIMMVLHKYINTKKYPVYVDGMARKIGNIYKRYRTYFRSYGELRNALEKSNYISRDNTFEQRQEAKRANAAIVAPSGMLKGGTSRMYAEAILDDPNSAILLVSYQIPGTPGEILLKENKYVYNNNEQVETSCEVELFDFSSHSGKTQLIDFAKKCNFGDQERRIFAVHGEEETATALCNEMNELGLHAVAPTQGETYKI